MRIQSWGRRQVARRRAAAAAARRYREWARPARQRRADAGAATATAAAARRIQRWRRRTQATRAAARRRTAYPQPVNLAGAWSPAAGTGHDEAAEKVAPVEPAADEGEHAPPGARATRELGTYNSGRCLKGASVTADDCVTGRAPARREGPGSGAARGGAAAVAPPARGRQRSEHSAGRVAGQRAPANARRPAPGAGEPAAGGQAPEGDVEHGVGERAEEAWVLVPGRYKPPPPPRAPPSPDAGSEAPPATADEAESGAAPRTGLQGRRRESGSTPGTCARARRGQRGGAAPPVPGEGRPASAAAPEAKAEGSARRGPEPAASSGERRSAGRPARSGGGGVGPLAAVWALMALSMTACAEDSAQMLEHADALCAQAATADAAARVANVEADCEVQRVRAELLRRSRGGGGAAEVGEPPRATALEAEFDAPPAAAEASAAATTAAEAEFARQVARAEAAGGAATKRGACCRCKALLPVAVSFSKKQRPRVARGTGKCKRCVAATCGWHEPVPSGSGGAKVWDARCAGCCRELSSDEFSNRQRELLRCGAAARCKACVHASGAQGRAEAEHAARVEARDAAEAAEPAVSAAALEAALARTHWRREARAAGRAAAAAAAAAVATIEDAGPVVLAGGGELECLANAWPAEFQDTLGRTYASVEHFIVHRKAATFGDEVRGALILGQPARALELGRLVAPFDEVRWALHRDGWERDALWRKFCAHPDMAAVLLRTGGRRLEGCGGEALQRVRARLRRAHAIARSAEALPWQCNPVNGGVDWELLADLLECYDAATVMRDREVVCSRTGARWSDVEFIDVLRRIPTEGGVPASAAAVAELDAGGVDRVAGRNGKVDREGALTSHRLLGAELEAGHFEGPFLTRAEMGPELIWCHPVSLADKNKDGSVKLKSCVDFVTGTVRDGLYGADLQPQKRWIDNLSAGRVPARNPDGSRSKSKPALDSLNAFSPLSTPCTLDDVPYISDLIMALKTDGGRLSGAAKREVQGSTIDIANAYRNVPLKREHRRLFCFRWLDVTKPVPQYVLDGGQPREADLVWYRKCVLPFGWISSVDYWVRLSKAVKALHMWDNCPGVTARVPRKQRPDGSWAPQHASAVYVDDSGLFGVVDDDGFNWADVSQARYIELCGMVGIPISIEKLKAEGAVSDVVAMLGVLMDCDREELRLSPARLEKLAAQCREVQGKAYVSRKELRSLVGVLSFAASCAPAGRTFMRRLYDAQKRKGKFCRINRGLKVDLNWWIKFVLADGGWHGASMLVEEYATTAEELGLFTDASLEGFGATFVLPDGTCEYFSGRWCDVLPGIDTSQETGEWHISELELLVVHMAMLQWSSHLTQRRVLTRCDNESAVHAINSGRARDPAMSLLLRELWFVKARG